MMNRRLKVLVLAATLIAVAVPAVLFVVPMLRDRNQNVALGREWADLLKRHAAFSGKRPSYPVSVDFSYSSPTDANLEKLRHTYDLETVAGRGSETDRIINLMTWVFRLTGHANEPEIPKELNAMYLIHLAKDEHKLINCYMKTIILNEVYLAMGFESRQTHLLPHSKEEDESHFITSVYSRTLRKWLFMDPDFGVYVTDEKNTILGTAEIRRRLIVGDTLVVHAVDEPQGVFARTWSDAREVLDGRSYLWYLSKNLFKVRCPQVSMFAELSQPSRVYVELIPDGYREELLKEPARTSNGKQMIYINDEKLFWQRPAEHLTPS